MIALYISTAFIKEFGLRIDKDNDIVFDFRNQFLRRIRGIEIFINGTIEEIKELANTNELYNDLTENPIKCDDSWLTKLEDETFLYSKPHSKVFLLGNDINCNALVSKYNLLFINNDNLKELWEQVRTDRQIAEMTPSEKCVDEYSFVNWEQLLMYKHPFHDIIILDFYLLGNKSNQKYNNNLIPMINNYLSFIGNDNFEISIISKEILNPPKENPLAKISESYSLINKPHCKLIYYDDSIINASQLKEHDREIITNYMVFECPAGWNLFKEKGGVNHRTKIMVKSLFRNDVRNSVNKALDSFRSYYFTVKSKKKQVFTPGQFDENNKLRFQEVDYHYPLDFHPSILESIILN